MPNWGPILRRAPSGPARCYRDLDGKVCGAELKLHVTRSPLPEYETLVTQVCANGHVLRVQGCLQYVPESWADEGPHGL